MAKFQDTLCSDEMVAERCIADYIQVAPLGGKVAYGEDGVLTADSPWDLSSATVDFAARGVESGHVVHLMQTLPPSKPTDILAVAATGGEAAAPYTLATRRIGEDAGFGHPPGPAPGGATLTRVQFQVVSFYPLIKDYTRYIKQELEIVDKTNADLETDGFGETAEMACVYFVLYEAYKAKAKEGSSSLGGAGRVAGSEFWSKSQEYLRMANLQLEQLRKFYRPELLEPAAESVAPTISVGVLRLNVRGRAASTAAE
jgi:hypothetical protein